ncbi:MAG: DUF2147 domain-containing protein [Acidobacteriota bacterium]
MHPIRLALAIVILTTAAHAATGVLGDWRTPSGSIVRVDRCGSDICLTVVQLQRKAPSTTDNKNPDPKLRHRSICGLTIGTGFHAPDPNHLSGGHLYDPQSGHDYRGNISADGDTLHLRGYIGISLFGRSETWHRSPTVPTCR